MTPAVLTALIATSLGLLSLYQSDVPMIQDFGLMLTIGIAIAFLLALLVLLPVLTARRLVKDKQPEQKKKHKKPSVYGLILEKMTKSLLKVRYLVLILAIVLAGLGFHYDQKVDVETDMEEFMPQDSQALEDIETLRETVGSTERIVLMYEAEDITSYETLNDVSELTDFIETTYHGEIEMMASMSLLLDQVSDDGWDQDNLDDYMDDLPESQVTQLQSVSAGQGIINLSLAEMSDDEFDTFLVNLNDAIDGMNLSMEVTITGQSIVDQAMLDAMTSDRLMLTLLGVLLVFFVLLLIYRSFSKALLVVVPILLIVGWSGGLMYLLGFDYTPLTSTLGALIIGIGTEFTILIMMRYQELRETLKDKKESIVKSVGLMGKPIIVSAITTMGGFSALIFSDFVILSNFGIMTLINLSLALLSSLIVLPAFLSIFGKTPKAVKS